MVYSVIHLFKKCILLFRRKCNYKGAACHSTWLIRHCTQLCYVSKSLNCCCIKQSNVQTGRTVHQIPCRDAMDSVKWNPKSDLLAYAGEDNHNLTGEGNMMFPCSTPGPLWYSTVQWLNLLQVFSGYLASKVRVSLPFYKANSTVLFATSMLYSSTQ